MKTYFILICATIIFAITQNASAQCTATITGSGKDCVGDTIKISIKNAFKLEWKKGTAIIKTLGGILPVNYGVTVAGRKNTISGSDSEHLSGTTGVFVDASGNIYVSDWNNNRVQKWAPGANYGITVAGQKDGSYGSDSAHLNNPYMLFVDSANNLYVADCHNNRVQMWAPGAKYGVTVAGQKDCSTSTDSLHISQPVGIYVDKNQNLYVCEGGNNRVTKWAKGAKYGITVAGQKDATGGADSAHLNNPYGMWVDAANNIYISDLPNNRIQKWTAGAKYGITVAGQENGTTGTDSFHINSPVGVFVDASQNIFVGDAGNARVQKWALGAKYGTTVAGHKNAIYGTDSTSLTGAHGLYIDVYNNLYIGDFSNNRVQKWVLGSLNLNDHYYYIADSAGTYSANVTYKGGCDTTSNSIHIYGCNSGVADLNNKNYTLSIYPNPNSGQFTLDLNTTNHTDKAYIQVLNLLGQTVRNQIADNSNGNIHATIGNTHLAEGVYFVRVTIGEVTHIAKIVIQK